MQLIDVQRGTWIPIADGFPGLGHDIVGDRFAHWDGLHEDAKEALERAIDHLKREHEWQTRDHKSMNLVNVERQEQASDDLVRWHWGRRPPTDARRLRKCHHLRRDLALDPIERKSNPKNG